MRVATVAPPRLQAVPAPAPDESPLGPRLKRKATRYGDAVPYGSHGPTGLYREGVKEFTTKIREDKITPEEASRLLAEEGVHIGPKQLSRKAKIAPGESPAKTGPSLKLQTTTEKELHSEIKQMRDHDITVTKSMVFAMANSLIRGRTEEGRFKDGVTDDWYYGFLDRYDMTADGTKPLESDRDLWLTSSVRALPTLAHAPLLPLAHSPLL